MKLTVNLTKPFLIYFAIACNLTACNWPSPSTRSTNPIKVIEKKVLAGHSHKLISATFSSDNKMVMTTAVDEGIRLWDTNSGSQIRNFPKPEVTSAFLSPNGKMIAITNGKGHAKFLDLETESEILDIDAKYEIGANFSTKGFVKKNELTNSVSPARGW